MHSYLSIEIVIEGHKYVCIPGKPLTEELVSNTARELQWLAVTIDPPVENEASPLLRHTETEIEVNTEEGEKAQRADEKYKESLKKH